MERAVGWFVVLAAALLFFGFGYYIYNTAKNKGWFKIKAPYFTFTDAATGLKVGDPVKLMGLDVGRITSMEPQPPWDFDYNMYVEFELREPYYGYIWTEGSKAKVAIADLLGKRYLEVTKGTGGYPTYVFKPYKLIDVSAAQSLSDWQQWELGQEIYDQSGTNLLVKALSLLSSNLPVIERAGVRQIVVLDARTNQAAKYFTAVWNDKAGRYDPFRKTKDKYYWLKSDESPAVTERLETLVSDVEKALPNILNLTNYLSLVLSNASNLTSNYNDVALSLKPAVSNLAAATTGINRPGGLGDWLFPTNIARELEGTLGSANATLASANTNINALLLDLDRSIDSLADLTSNLNHQVQQNTNILSEISKAVVDTDDLVQGLKHHWLLRSAFKTKKTNAPPAKVTK
jgi:ABC-type transporter Mla subunit MlaD